MMDNHAKQSRWAEITTRVLWEEEAEPTSYPDGNWTQVEQLTVTITRCGSADTKPGAASV
ncbi:hypothetical protein ACIO3O_18475 [Streptomyces sp. NPDC087440]|uniref:hypothetical protein n=1 Tax=Streptomyces sp. NPDC087440 TaxID=3365790 RepID=UPI00382FAD46